MTSPLQRLRTKALKKPGVREAYDAMADEFVFLSELLRARAEAGLTQAEVADRAGTTQSSIARLESGAAKHSPSIVTLQKYAKAVGCRVEIRLVKEARQRALEKEARQRALKKEARQRELKPAGSGRRR